MDNKQLEKAVASLLQSGDRQALAELIVEYVQPNHIPTDILNLLLDTRALNLGDSLIKKVRKGIKVYSLVPGAIHPTSEITVNERTNFNLDGAHVSVTYSDWELRAGHIGSVEEIRAEMLAKLRDFYMVKVFNMLSSIWSVSNNSSNFTSVGGVVTSTALKAAIDNVNLNGGGVKAVFGSRAAMTPITTFGAGWDIGNTDDVPVDSQLEEVMKTGFLGVYYGAPLIVFDQVYDNPDDYNPLLPTDKILVIGKKAGEFITYGPVTSEQYVDPKPTPSQWVLKLWQQFGLIVDRAEGIHVLGDLS